MNDTLKRREPLIPQTAAIAEAARLAGVVCADGQALADKMRARRYRSLIVSAVRRDPLLCGDWAALAQYGNCVVEGARLLAEALEVGKTILATSEEFADTLPALASAARQAKVGMARLPDLYPLGIETVLKRELLGVPFDRTDAADILIVDAEALRNLSWAVGKQRSVITRLVTIAGAVHAPVTLQVAVGTSFRDCLAHAGGASCAHFAAFRNGVPDGKAIDLDDAHVDATTTGYVVLPITHSMVQPPATDDPLGARLVLRRRAFLEATHAGRLQPMNAVCALFDLLTYRRAGRPFRSAPLPAAAALARTVPGA